MIKKNLITKQGDKKMTNLINKNKTISIDTKLGKVDISYFDLIIKDYSDAGEDPYYIGHVQAVFKQDNPWSAMYFADRNEEDWDNMNSFLKTIEDVTKNMIKESFPELEDAEIHYSEQGMQGKNFMDMDIHFISEPINGEKFGRVDEERTNKVFSKIVGGDNEASIMFKVDEDKMKSIA